MSISAKMVADLREKTGAGMMDCKKALTETNGDFEQAVDWLRKKGLAAASKKAGRIAAEGLVSIYSAGKTGSVLEVNIETDFAAKNDMFQSLVRDLTAAYSKFNSDDIEAFKASAMPSGKTVADEIVAAVAVIGENISLRRGAKLTVQNGMVASYIHNAAGENIGKIGVLVALESTASADKLAMLGKQLAMHIAASKPEALDVADLDPALVEKEKAVLSDQARASGKPEAVIEKMVEGRLVKFYEQTVFLQQLFVMDGKTRITEVVAQAGKEAGADIKVKGYIRFALGEGIEKKEVDFAKEVAEAAAGF